MPRTVAYHCERCGRVFNVPTYHIYLTWLAWQPFRLHRLVHLLRDWWHNRRREH